MKFVVYFLLVGLTLSISFAQKSSTDSLKQLLTQPMADSSRVLVLDELGRSLMYSKPLEAMQLAQEGLVLAKKIKYEKGESRILNRLGSILRITGNYPSALSMHLASLKIAENNNDLDGMAKTLNNMGILYLEQKDAQKANAYFRQTKTIAEKINEQNLVLISLINIGSNYAKLNQLDSALIYTQEAYRMALNQQNNNINVLLMNLGNIYFRIGNYPLSLKYYHQSLPYSIKTRNNRILSQTFLEMAQVFKNNNAIDSCLYYAKKSFEVAQNAQNMPSIFEASKLLSLLYDSLDKSQAYTYFKLAAAAKDTMFNQEKVKELQNIGFNEQLRHQELENAQKEYLSRQRIGLLLGILVFIIILTGILYRNNLHKQKAYTLLQQQKAEINLQRDKAEKALLELKQTQAQLIQKEKLANLGELTAGIAHEIQNPLNFVNNFSELSIELLEEMNEEIDRGDIEEAKTITGDLTQNLQKINLHGRRASSIVSSMLEHSRASTGERVLTDINKLADEYLRLSYHGMRAKDKTFNAEYELMTNENLPLVSIVPQDIGRVLLNLLNNAFYAVWQRQNLTGFSTAKVIVATQHANQQIIIRVKDNGTGMSEATKAKIFQPFFTTKPTGEGTGLGLSLSYDIITKGHGGSLEVQSTEGVGTEFILHLPIDKK
ncbi:MAG: tetratricopeptide repeat protein [Spirosomataceae bacterium]